VCCARTSRPEDATWGRSIRFRLQARQWGLAKLCVLSLEVGMEEVYNNARAKRPLTEYIEYRQRPASRPGSCTVLSLRFADDDARGVLGFPRSPQTFVRSFSLIVLTSI